MLEKHAYRVGAARHGSTVQRGYTVRIFHIWIETAFKHGCKDLRIAAFSRNMHQEVMFLTELIAECRILGEHCYRPRVVT